MVWCLLALLVAAAAATQARPAAGGRAPPTAPQLEGDIAKTYLAMDSLETKIKLENAGELIFAPIEFERAWLTCLRHGSTLHASLDVVNDLQELKALDVHLGEDLRNLKTRFPAAYVRFLRDPAVEVQQERQAELRKAGRAKSCRKSSPCSRPQSVALGLTGYEFQDGTVRYGWGTGAVVMTSNDGSPARKANFGRTSTDVAHEGPWKCGATVTLTARPDQGMRFDHWASREGLCKGSSPKCKTKLVANATNSHDIQAFFAVTVDTLSATNANSQGGILQGGRNTLSCGDLGNLTGTHCSARVPAQRSSTDLQEVDADANGAHWSVASIGPCDRVVYNTTSDGRRIQARCYVAMIGDRNVTVTWAQVG
jgi:hypothetical protein